MDVFLDVLDTFFFDRLYALILPATNPVEDTVRESQKLYNQNIGRYVPLAPSPYVDASIWKRDDIVRQATSLFLIAW
jgi:lathosterol oxidase